MLAQLVGRKRMLLWPPAALPDLHLYPATHTAFRQSQVPLGAAAAAAAQPPGSPAARAMATLPGFASAALRAAVLVDLEPGDCVYIPPYWGHGVYSVEPSVSLASFSTSWEQVRAAAMRIGPPSTSPPSPLHLPSISPPSPLCAQARWARSGWIAAPLGRFVHAPCDRVRGGVLVLLAFLRAMAPALGVGPRDFISQVGRASSVRP